MDSEEPNHRFCLVQSTRITPPTLQFLVQINCFVILGHPLNYFHPSIIASRPSATLLHSNPQSRTQIAIRLAPLGAIQAYFLSVHTWPKPLIVSNRHIYIPAFSSPHRSSMVAMKQNRSPRRQEDIRSPSTVSSDFFVTFFSDLGVFFNSRCPRRKAATLPRWRSQLSQRFLALPENVSRYDTF